MKSILMAWMFVAVSASAQEGETYFTLRSAEYLPAVTHAEHAEPLPWMRPLPNHNDVHADPSIQETGPTTMTFDVVPGDWLRFDLSSLPAGPAEVEIGGHAQMICNGLPRPGLPFKSGQFRYPITIEPGHNELLVQAAEEKVDLWAGQK